MKILKLIYHVLVITVALYLVRPVECVYHASVEAFDIFIYTFKCKWEKEGWESLALYKRAWRIFKGEEVIKDD